MANPNIVDVPLKSRQDVVPAGDGFSRCPYCLENFSTETLARRDARICPICRHDILPTLLGCPLHLLNRRQQWAHLLNEMKYIWDWEYSWFSFIRRKPPGSLFEFQYEKTAFEDLCDAYHGMKSGGELLITEPGELETLALDRLREWGQSNGLLARDLLEGKPWRELARELSAEAAGQGRVAAFQLDYVTHLAWGVFESSRQREDITRYLKERLDQLDRP